VVDRNTSAAGVSQPTSRRRPTEPFLCSPSLLSGPLSFLGKVGIVYLPNRFFPPRSLLIGETSKAWQTTARRKSCGDLEWVRHWAPLLVSACSRLPSCLPGAAHARGLMRSRRRMPTGAMYGTYEAFKLRVGGRLACVEGFRTLAPMCGLFLSCWPCRRAHLYPPWPPSPPPHPALVKRAAWPFCAVPFMMLL
jgi:hypothetical protein